jgi:hypothetical protein
MAHPVLGVVQDEMTLREGAALGVLSRQANRDAFDEQRCERERFRLAPVDPALLDRLQAALELREQLRVHGEALGDLEQLRVEHDERLARDGRVDLQAVLARDAALLARRRGERLLELLVGGAEPRLHLAR